MLSYLLLFLGVSTLKRIWGYIGGYATTRVGTLNILARFAGFTLSEPLYVTHFVHDGQISDLFVMGKKGGLTRVKVV